MKKIITACVLAALTTGCVHTELAVKNSCPETITVTSGHTGKSFSIGPGKTASVPHTIGSISVETESGKTWQYSEVTSTDGEPRRHFIVSRRIVKAFEITEQGTPRR